MPVGSTKLITDMARDAGLDPSRSDRDQRESNEQPTPWLQCCREERRWHVHQRQAEMTNTIHQREQENSRILAEKRIGNNATNDWKKIGSGDKKMHPLPRLRFIHSGRLAGRGQKILRHENDKDRLHSIEAKSLCRFVAHDKRDPRWHPRCDLRQRLVGGLLGGHGKGKRLSVWGLSACTMVKRMAIWTMKPCPQIRPPPQS